MADASFRIISRRYVRALLALAQSQALLDGLEQDARMLQDAIAGSPEFSRLLTNPLFSRPAKAIMIHKLSQALGLSAMMQQFLQLLARNRRLDALGVICQELLAEISRLRGELPSKVVSAHPLSASQIQAIEKLLAQYFKKTPKIITRQEPELLGGVVIEAGGLMIDHSLKHRLNRLKQTLTGDKAA